MADLLSVWSVAELKAKYCNPYAGDEDKQVGTFKALEDTWKLPEVREWHKHLGDFWGPIILHLRETKHWMPIGMAFDTGVEHGFCVKNDEERIESWRRGACEVSSDSPVRSMFKAVLDEIKPAYAIADHPRFKGLT
jgi:hypothetical protein